MPIAAARPASPASPAPGAAPGPWAGLVTVLLGLLGPLGIWLVAVGAAAMLASPEVASGQCEGLGWGCQLSPRGSVAFAGFIGGVVVVPAVTLLIGVVTLLRPADRRRQTVVGGVTAFAVAAIAVAGFVLVSVLANG